jgi:hypothetical protein
MATGGYLWVVAVAADCTRESHRSTIEGSCGLIGQPAANSLQNKISPCGTRVRPNYHNSTHYHCRWGRQCTAYFLMDAVAARAAGAVVKEVEAPTAGATAAASIERRPRRRGRGNRIA